MSVYDEILSNPKSPRAKRVAALARKRERTEQGHFLVEGPQAVRELLTHRPELADVVFATQHDEPWKAELKELTEQANVYLDYVTDSVMSAMSETVTPQGILAVAQSWETDLAETLKDARLVVIMHEVRDPGNAGAVLRAADAAGADAVIFAGESIDPFHPKVVRSTTGSIFHLPVAVTATLDEAVAAVRDAGITSLAADVRGSDVLAARANGVLAGRVAWVFGNEARGLSEADRELVDLSLKLPIYGAAESLNLATAASVLIYETAFAQRA